MTALVPTTSLSAFFQANPGATLTGLRVVSVRGRPGTLVRHDPGDDDYCHFEWDGESDQTGGAYAHLAEKVTVQLDAAGQPIYAAPQAVPVNAIVAQFGELLAQVNTASTEGVRRAQRDFERAAAALEGRAKTLDTLWQIGATELAAVLCKGTLEARAIVAGPHTVDSSPDHDVSRERVLTAFRALSTLFSGATAEDVAEAQRYFDLAKAEAQARRRTLDAVVASILMENGSTMCRMWLSGRSVSPPSGPCR